jgi:ubiquitin-protein ligase
MVIFIPYDYAVHIKFVQAIPAQPAKIHAPNAIFHYQIALSQGISASIILVNR